MKRFLTILSCLLFCLSPLVARTEEGAANVDVMKDCEDAIAVVAIQMTFAEMMNVQLPREQAEKAVETMKQNKDGSYEELAVSAREFCNVLKQELKKEVKKDSRKGKQTSNKSSH